MHLRAAAFAAALSLISLTASAQNFLFDLSGAQEVPPVTTTATGGCFGVLNQPVATFSITCVHDVPNATIMHIHHGAPGATGTVAFDLGDPAVQPITRTWTGMSASDIADLLAGNLYVNIHTAGRPNGEIRGQILPRTVDTVAFTADGQQVVPPDGSSATASCTANLNDAATALAIDCTHTLAGATAAHVHAAPFGQNGPIVYTFPSAVSPFSGSVPMTPELLADFAATFLYLDIHTPAGTEDAPGDEIRGQIGMPPASPLTGTVIVEKETSPAGGTGFGFTESITSGNFTLDDGGSRTFNSVAPGTYTVAENDPSAANYTLDDVTCSDADSSGNTAARTATIHVDAGETVRCTFRNLATSPADTLFVFHLSGDQEVPPNPTSERGGCEARFNAGTSSLSIVCVHDVVNATVMHIHHGAAGTAGTVAFDLGTPTSPVIATWTGMSPADVADLMAGHLYVNIHTAGRPTGAIRGQILPRTVDTIAFTADGLQAVPPGASSATANCTADLDNAATSLSIQCTHTLVNPDVAHVHEAPRGVNGPVVYTFPSAASPLNGNMPMTPRLVADFAAYFLYLEIHGPDAGEETAPDEIRGQIAPPVVFTTTGTIHIRKATSPAGEGGFSFTETITPGGFTLADGGEQTFASVPAGTYSVTEAAKSGWSLTNLVCSDADSTGNLVTRSATINLQAGESVTCTFTNLESVAAPMRFVFQLNGAQEVPPTNSTARGGCYGELDPTTRRFELVCTHNVLSPVTAHIHHGAAGATGNVVFELADPTSPIEATWMMTPEQVTELLAGNYYLNIHASGRPLGEIRGQILPRTVDRISFPLSGAQEVPPTDSPATGNCIADLSDDASSLALQCSHTIPNPTDTHLHDAPPGLDGPVVFDLPDTPTFNATAPLTPRLIADFAAGFLYVNVHSVNYDTGEIRGQVFGPAAAAVDVANAPTLGVVAAMLMMLALVVVGWGRVR